MIALDRGGALKGGMPLYKFFGNKILSTFQNLLLGTRLSEFHSGYRLYRTQALAAVPFELNSNDFHFDTEIIIQFRPVPHSMFAERGSRLHQNKLIIRLQPEEEISLMVMAKEPGLDREGVRLREVPLDLSLTTAFAGARRRIAYERLLLDLIEGDPTLFVRRDEVEAQWTWIDRIREGWAASATKPARYASGSWGPEASFMLTRLDGATWQD